MKTFWLALVLLLAPPAYGQPTVHEEARLERLQLQAQPAGREYAPNRFQVVQDVDRACPGLVLQDHAFTDAVVMELRRRYPSENWGRNGKRGNTNDPSHDAIFMPTSASPFGGAVIDIIAAAGSRDARAAWIDQTDATVAANTTGVWVAPSGVLPACLTGGGPGPTPDPDPVPPVVTPPVQVDLTEVLVALSRIEQRLTALENHSDTASSEMLEAYIDDMVGKGPGDRHPEIPNRITDFQLRLDALRVQLEQLNAWLRGRAVLRY